MHEFNGDSARNWNGWNVCFVYINWKRRKNARVFDFDWPLIFGWVMARLQWKRVKRRSLITFHGPLITPKVNNGYGQEFIFSFLPSFFLLFFKALTFSPCYVLTLLKAIWRAMGLRWWCHPPDRWPHFSVASGLPSEIKTFFSILFFFFYIKKKRFYSNFNIEFIGFK